MVSSSENLVTENQSLKDRLAEFEAKRKDNEREIKVFRERTLLAEEKAYMAQLNLNDEIAKRDEIIQKTCTERLCEFEAKMIEHEHEKSELRRQVTCLEERVIDSESRLTEAIAEREVMMENYGEQIKQLSDQLIDLLKGKK